MARSPILHCLLALGVAATLAGPLVAQDFPTRGMRLMVGAAAGGPVDAAARIASQRLGDVWQQPVTVENRVGASEMIAAEFVSKAAPDGYTLLACSLNVFTINPVVFAKVPYDPVNGFVPVALLTRNAMVIAAHPKTPYQSLREMIEFAKSKPGDIQYSSPGLATTNHITGEWIANEAGIQLFHVPFKGGPAAANAILNGDVPIGVVSLIQALPFAKTGQIKALAVTTAKRTALAPDMPSIAEAGVPGVDAAVLTALFAPAGTPPAVVAKLNAELNRQLQLPDTRERLAAMGVEPGGSTPQELGQVVSALRKKIEDIVARAKIKVQ